mmetsp:Transcript_91125/g.174773  ORF Transcript_91125/g.174773 Transcript_91125/m.174773 type:complete len:498 (-) Transcript_91125:20-1513(-)
MPGGPVRLAGENTGPAATALRGAAPELREKLRRRLSRCTEGGCGVASTACRPGRWRQVRREQSEVCTPDGNPPSLIGIQGDATQEENNFAEGMSIDGDSASSDSDGDPLDYLMLEVASRMPQEDAAALLEKLQRQEQRHARTKQRLREHLAAKQRRVERHSIAGSMASPTSLESSGHSPTLRVLMSPRLATSSGLKEAAAGASAVTATLPEGSPKQTKEPRVASTTLHAEDTDMTCGEQHAGKCMPRGQRASTCRFATAIAVVGILLFFCRVPLSAGQWRQLPKLGMRLEEGGAAEEAEIALPREQPRGHVKAKSAQDVVTMHDTLMAQVMQEWSAGTDIQAADPAPPASNAATQLSRDVDAAPVASAPGTEGERAAAAQSEKARPPRIESEVARRARERAAELALTQKVQQQVRRATEAAAVRLAGQEAKQKAATESLEKARRAPLPWESVNAAKEAQARRAALRERVQALEAGAQRLPEEQSDPLIPSAGFAGSV